ncbi:hypothetical protein Val02_38770 [Virgisporangium aliadipatigenens]|uniref:DUF72 domain-containing protein n=1 Tax=Virgisporangium aliadipatigenens TaxID=741659 RepID=A0A8J4DRE8_9ACTN|nr:DUF72 domain-containing protein [Virgisporangium aliadipatigenens]GIJ46991.1 hypothetical protein Val02_38770 [Virgisporangium aliadipatigenens]
MGEILVGTSSWADRLLLASGWYPKSVNTPAGRLAYYAERFPIVEVDTSYYAIPAVETSRAWVERTPDDFTFNVKAFSLLTGHSTPVDKLPADLRPYTSRRTVRRADLPESTVDIVWERFHEFVAPIASAGKLGVVLLQFPPWLVCTDAGRRRIAHTVERCRPLPVAVELRHGSWFTDQRRSLETLTFLVELGASFCCVDMPQGSETSVPPILVGTADPVVIRFHGHSHAWDTGDKQEKFRYAYTEQELRAWVRRIRPLAEESDAVHVLLNNCCGDQAQKDAARLRDLISATTAAA